MAKKAKLDYGALIKELRAKGPGNLYLLWGEEDYLRESFFAEIKKLCLGDGEEDFNHKRFNGPSIDVSELSHAVDTMPFFADRTLIEVRDFDINKCKDAQAKALGEVLKEVPDYCTIVFLLPSDYSPDGRLGVVKNLKKLGHDVEFTPQEQGQLVNWVRRRFQAQGKDVGINEAQRLIYLSGSLMNRLIPEIDKIASYSKGGGVTIEEIEAVATRTPEASVFDMCDKLAMRKYGEASRLLSELLGMGEHPIMLLALIGQQFRRLYAARLAMDKKLGRGFVKEVCNVRYDFIIDKLNDAARGFELERLRKGVVLCADTDYKFKSSGMDDVELLRELILRI